jgi:hypothetical protein
MGLSPPIASVAEGHSIGLCFPLPVGVGRFAKFDGGEGGLKESMWVLIIELALELFTYLSQRHTLVKYLLDELYTYEDDYSGMLLPLQPEANKTFLGEAAAMGPATTEQLSLFHQSLSSDMRAMSGAMNNLANNFAGVSSGKALVFPLSIKH